MQLANLAIFLHISSSFYNTGGGKVVSFKHFERFFQNCWGFLARLKICSRSWPHSRYPWPTLDRFDQSNQTQPTFFDRLQGLPHSMGEMCWKIEKCMMFSGDFTMHTKVSPTVRGVYPGVSKNIEYTNKYNKYMFFNHAPP